jgi:hypothetical protein
MHDCIALQTCTAIMIICSKQKHVPAEEFSVSGLQALIFIIKVCRQKFAQLKAHRVYLTRLRIHANGLKYGLVASALIVLRRHICCRQAPAARTGANSGTTLTCWSVSGPGQESCADARRTAQDHITASTCSTMCLVVILAVLPSWQSVIVSCSAC